MARYTGNHCPVCEQAFTDDDDIVVCPDCGTPYHRACWQKVGACLHQSEHAAGFEWVPEFGPEAEAAAHDAVCPNCGTHNEPGAARCSHCGVPLPRHGEDPQQPAGPVYARQPGSVPDRQPAGPRMEGYSAGPDGGIYRREVGPEDAIDGVKAKHWAAFVGRSPMYYLMQFFRMEATKHRVTFSFSAFFLGPAYLLYRKMWKYGLLTAALSLLFFMPGLMSTAVYYDADFFGSMPLGWLPAVTTVCDIANWGMRVLLALFSVSLYEKHGKARIESICARFPEGPDRTEELARSGGTSLAAAILYFAVILLVEAVFLMPISLKLLAVMGYSL